MESVIANSPLRDAENSPFEGSLFGEFDRVFTDWCHSLRRWCHMGSWPWFGLAEGGLALDTSERVGLKMRHLGRHDPSPGDNDPDEPASDARRPFHHESVMLQEVVSILNPQPGKLMFDGTLGGGGHAEALLAGGVKLVAMDQDPDAIAHATGRLQQFENRFCAIRGNFRHFPEILAETGVSGFDGILVDLGVSSFQLDEPTRGFSFQHDGPLDLRMDQDSPRTAADIVNLASEEEIERILREYGEEPHSRRIARAIVKNRDKKPILSTAQLAEMIRTVVGRKGRRHPATLAFQALRIAVNDELAALHQFLEAAPRWLKPGGRLAVISFHSLEDRIVKQAFHHLSAPTIDRPEWPEPKPNPHCCLKLLTRKPMEPTAEEIARNPRARSARLRAAERLP